MPSKWSRHSGGKVEENYAKPWDKNKRKKCRGKLCTGDSESMAIREVVEQAHSGKQKEIVPRRERKLCQKGRGGKAIRKVEENYAKPWK